MHLVGSYRCLVYCGKCPAHRHVCYDLTRNVDWLSLKGCKLGCKNRLLELQSQFLVSNLCDDLALSRLARQPLGQACVCIRICLDLVFFRYGSSLESHFRSRIKEHLKTAKRIELAHICLGRAFRMQMCTKSLICDCLCPSWNLGAFCNEFTCHRRNFQDLVFVWRD